MGKYELRPLLVDAERVVIGDKGLAKWCLGSYGPHERYPGKTFLIFEGADGLMHYVGEGDWVVRVPFNGFIGMSHDEFLTTYREVEFAVKEAVLEV